MDKGKIMLVGYAGPLMMAELLAASRAGVDVVIVDKKTEPRKIDDVPTGWEIRCMEYCSIPPPMRPKNEPWRSGRKDARFKK